MSLQIDMTRRLTAALIMVAIATAGCAGSSTPLLDAKFGDSVRAARESQTLNPAASANQDPVLGIDGKAAVQAQERYQDSFKTPPRTFEIINIGGALTGQ